MEKNQISNLIALNESQTRNFEEFQKMIMLVRKDGNKKSLSVKLFKENDISETYFVTFKEDCKKLYSAIELYIKSEFKVDSNVLNEMKSKIFEQWKILLNYTKENEKIHVNTSHIDVLIGFTRTLTNDSNFIGAKKAIAINSESNFRKKVEIILGIILDKADVIDSEKLMVLRKEKSLINKIDKCSSKIDSLCKEISTKKDSLKLEKKAETKAYIQAEINVLEETLVNTDTNKKKFEVELINLKKADKVESIA